MYNHTHTYIHIPCVCNYIHSTYTHTHICMCIYTYICPVSASIYIVLTCAQKLVNVFDRFFLNKRY